MARRSAPEVNAGSMADIAFLLLIFFLVTTTIDTDKGLGIVLPPPGDMEIEIRKENILNCLINSQGKVLLDEEPEIYVEEKKPEVTNEEVDLKESSEKELSNQVDTSELDNNEGLDNKENESGDVKTSELKEAE